MRTRFIQTEILILLSDNQIHKAKDIADELGINKKTVYRHVEDLSIRYDIKMSRTGEDKGIKLLRNETNYINNLFSLWEIDFLLELLPTDINSKKVEILKNKLMLLKEKGEVAGNE